MIVDMPESAAGEAFELRQGHRYIFNLINGETINMVVESLIIDTESGIPVGVRLSMDRVLLWHAIAGFEPDPG